ncbi:MAG: hypothetical protein A4E48_02747 [Methanosaeta sp. PtaU1.Bin060]|nr:MAG: hypothetical protein A4E48_02747 [Methanosaeta sp. PtaU1.Bin060]
MKVFLLHMPVSIEFASIQTLPRSSIILPTACKHGKMSSPTNLAFHQASAWVDKPHHFLGHGIIHILLFDTGKNRQL